MSFYAALRSQLGYRGLGWKRSADPRRGTDFQKLGLASASLPASATNRPYVLSVLNQQATESCVSEAIAQAIRMEQVAGGESNPELAAALFLYFNGRAETGDQQVDGGSYIDATLQACLHFGYPAEALWPFNPMRVNRRPSWSAYRGAAQMVNIRSWYRILETSDDGILLAIRAAIAAGKAVIGGWPVTRAFTEDAGPQLVDDPSGPIAGNHAMVLTSYDQTGSNDNFEVVSSWSDSWRDQGFVKLTPAYVLRGSEFTVFELEH